MSLDRTTLTIWGEEKGSPTYFTGTFDATGNVPRVRAAEAQDTTRTDGSSGGEQAGDDEVRGLDPAEVAATEGAE